MIESELKNIVRIDGVFYFFLEMTWRFSLCFFGKYVILFFVEEMVWKKKIARLDFSGSSRANGRKKCG